jgi:hypothetical protein
MKSEHILVAIRNDTCHYSFAYSFLNAVNCREYVNRGVKFKVTEIFCTLHTLLSLPSKGENNFHDKCIYK